MFVLCTALLYDSTAATRTLKLSTSLLSISSGIHLISLLIMSSLVCGLFSQTLSFYVFCSVQEMRRHLLSRTGHLNTSGITSHVTDSFCVKPITPVHPIPKISTCLTIFWRDTWKTEFVKTIHRQVRTLSAEKSDGFHKKCSVKLWPILMFELMLCCHTAA